MTLTDHRFPNFCSSLKSILLASVFKRSPSQSPSESSRPDSRNIAGTRSGTITWAKDPEIEVSTSQASPIPSPGCGSRRYRFKRRKRYEKGAEPMTHSHSHSTPNDDALNSLSTLTQTSQTETQGVSSISAQLVNDPRSPATASRMPHEHLWHENAPASVDLDALDEAFLQRSSETQPLHDMLCHIQPTVVVNVENDESKGFTERDNDALREHFSVRTNLVLTSTCPEVAPHIVISPAIDTPDDFYIPWMNRVNYHGQEPNRLPVPGFDPSRLARMPYRDEQCYWPVTTGHRISMARGIPRRVFSKSRFHQLVEETGSERLTMYHVVSALQRHRFKAIAFETSQHAKIRADRYNDASFLESLEKPFVWTDPAEPLLKCAGYPGVVIFDSANPFSVPHIMICSPPPQDPWIHYSTATNDPQDGGFGRYLVVPSQAVNFINMSPTQYPSFESILDDDDYNDSCSDISSEPDTPEPRTPIDLEDEERYLGWKHPAGYDDEDENENDRYGPCANDIQYENLASRSWENSKSAINEDRIQEIPERPSKHIFYFDDEEEEDDLPPLDDWYLSVASRNGIQIAC